MQMPDSWLVMTSLVLLTSVVLVGALTAYARLADKNTPFDIGLLHGRAGAAVTLVLVGASLTGAETNRNVTPATGLLVLTIMGGVALYYLIRRKGVLPKSVIFIHAAFAIAAVHTLLFGLPF